MSNELSPKKQKDALNNLERSNKKEHKKELKQGKKLNRSKTPRIPRA